MTAKCYFHFAIEEDLMQPAQKSAKHRPAEATIAACLIPLLALILVLFAGATSYAAWARTEPGPPPQVVAQTQGAVANTIRGNIATYAKSIDDADTDLAARIWWDSPEVSFIHPLGHEHGFDQIKQNVYQRLMGETFSERKLTPRDIVIHVYGDVAWAEFYWDFNAKFRKDGQPITTHGRETQIYCKMEGSWRLVHVHYSGMPATQPGQGF
jgi:ketosteroid isomerase-like protein